MDAVWDGRSNGYKDKPGSGFGDRSMGRSDFGGEYGVPYCNQWRVCGIIPKSLLYLLLFLLYKFANIIDCELLVVILFSMMAICYMHGVYKCAAVDSCKLCLSVTDVGTATG